MAVIGPAPKPKVYHKAALINSRGQVSPVCADKPRPLRLSRETWTNRWEAVTCKRCLAKRPTPTPSEQQT